ncbi:hypothetical protein BO71DRAFT_408163 [Aspergillus ellipticus CBS 707.79]|uniref:Uncharacterized protein n=1 Tax=Aspergillus ellipticus CBS 707.79 TaxID=1448320 RepID=A0A319DEN8_9EURO|nr:hypothetical protein BO71DRAFT_408163 [Aspergillus ellipticus CBS 707.79]
MSIRFGRSCSKARAKYMRSSYSFPPATTTDKRVAAHHGLKKVKDLPLYLFYLSIYQILTVWYKIQIYSFKKKITGENILKYWVLYLSWRQARYLYKLNKILYLSLSLRILLLLRSGSSLIIAA